MQAIRSKDMPHFQLPDNLMLSIRKAVLKLLYNVILRDSYLVKSQRQTICNLAVVSKLMLRIQSGTQ